MVLAYVSESLMKIMFTVYYSVQNEFILAFEVTEKENIGSEGSLVIVAGGRCNKIGKNPDRNVQSECRDFTENGQKK